MLSVGHKITSVAWIIDETLPEKLCLFLSLQFGCAICKEYTFVSWDQYRSIRECSSVHIWEFYGLYTTFVVVYIQPWEGIPSSQAKLKHNYFKYILRQIRKPRHWFLLYLYISLRKNAISRFPYQSFSSDIIISRRAGERWQMKIPCKLACNVSGEREELFFLSQPNRWFSM